MENKSNSAKNAAESTKDAVLTAKEYNLDLIKKMEEERGQKLIDISDLRAEGYTKLYYWLKKIAKYGNTKRTMLIFLDIACKKDLLLGIKVLFYTGDNMYCISARRNTMGYLGYLGCTVHDRKGLVGEDRNHGSDLPDGPYNEKTWESILNRIVGYEMKNLQCWRSEKDDPYIFPLAHVAIYAKGWYKESDNIWHDLQILFGADGYLDALHSRDIVGNLLNKTLELKTDQTKPWNMVIGISPEEMYMKGYPTKGNNYVRKHILKVEEKDIPEYNYREAVTRYCLHVIRYLHGDRIKKTIPDFKNVLPLADGKKLTDVKAMFGSYINK